jgi:hypothetical protein
LAEYADAIPPYGLTSMQDREMTGWLSRCKSGNARSSHHIALSSVAALWAAMVVPLALGAELKCDVGPVRKTYGMTQWLVYSCDDARTLVIVSDPESPAAPFYFTAYPKDGGYQIEGEGTGRKELTDAALEELKRWSERDIKSLIEQTRSLPNSR